MFVVLAVIVFTVETVIIVVNVIATEITTAPAIVHVSDRPHLHL